MIPDVSRRETPPLASLMRAGLPLALWLGFIALSSGDFGAERNTDADLWRWLASWFPGLLGGEAWATAAGVLSWLVRKAAHLVEYAVLGVVAAWALRRWVASGGEGHEPDWAFGSDLRDLQRMTIIVLVFGSLVSLGDELNQTTVALRTGSLADALLDVLGLALGLWCASLIARRAAGS